MKSEEKIKEFISSLKNVGKFNKFCNSKGICTLEYKGEENEQDFPIIIKTLEWVLEEE